MTESLQNDDPHSVSAVPSPVEFLGIRYSPITLEQTLAVLESFVRQRKPRQVNFCNALTIAMCWRHPEFRAAINASDLNLADGMSVVWGSRFLGRRFPERVAGPDLMDALCGRAAAKGYRVFLLGSSASNVERLRDELIRVNPMLKIVGAYSPPMCAYFAPEETERMIDQVNAASADLLFVGISSPKQERWINENLSRLNAPVSLAVGAAFDFLSGRIPRAPEWLRRRGLEWVYRLYREPRRLWKRYLWGNFIFLFLLSRERWRRAGRAPLSIT